MYDRHRYHVYFLKCYMSSKKIRQSTLALFLKIDRAQMNRILNGKRGTTYKTAVRIADRLNITDKKIRSLFIFSIITVNFLPDDLYDEFCR